MCSFSLFWKDISFSKRGTSEVTVKHRLFLLLPQSSGRSRESSPPLQTLREATSLHKVSKQQRASGSLGFWPKSMHSWGGSAGTQTTQDREPGSNFHETRLRGPDSPLRISYKEPLLDLVSTPCAILCLPSLIPLPVSLAPSPPILTGQRIRVPLPLAGAQVQQWLRDPRLPAPLPRVCASARSLGLPLSALPTAGTKAVLALRGAPHGPAPALIRERPAPRLWSPKERRN